MSPVIRARVSHRAAARFLAAWLFVLCGCLASGETPEVHWSLRPLDKPALPGAAAHPVDAFVGAKLSAFGLAFSAEADRRTLIRRLSFGLTGLPPSPDAVGRFLADNDPQAYENLIDRLLASPRYGEHWARRWLDVAHYADTHGNDHDYARPNAWPYRDYVIRSLNADKPYTRFVREQVAGDALYPEEPEATAALGFLAAGPWDDTLMVTIREDTVDHRMGQNLDRDGMVSAVMGTFQSLTVHCARCHDHKFDPISQREYYALQAVFAGVDRADRPVDPDPEIHAQRRQLQRRKDAIARRDPALLATLETPEVAERVAAAEEEFLHRAARWNELEITGVTSHEAAGATIFTPEPDGSWSAGGARPEKDTFVITAQTKLAGLRTLRLEVLPDERLPQGGPGRYDNGNFHLAGFRAAVSPLAESTETAAVADRVDFVRATADHADGADAVANTLDGNPDTYWSIHPRYGEPHEAVFSLREPAGTEHGSTWTVWLDFTGKSGHQIGRFRLSASTESLGEDPLPEPFPAGVVALLRVPAAERDAGQRQELALRVLDLEASRGLAALPPPQLVYAATHDFIPQGSFKPAPGPRPIHLLVRGDINRPADLVEPAALACLPGLPGALAIADATSEVDRRAAFALWLTDERNVLTWRSIVNRVWHSHFGRGLCDTPNDFGAMGGQPSHPELLDWLAVWFRDAAGGSLKALHRLLLTSAAYRQQVNDEPDAAGALRDAENRLLWRMNRLRLTGEQVRDAALQCAGRLDTRMGGPPAMHFLHQGDATFNPGGAPPFVDYANFDQDSVENGRRAVYRFVFRTVPDPLMDALDCPDGGAAVPVRVDSSTAQQALALLNDAFLIRQSENIARSLAAEHNEEEARISQAFQLLLQRHPSPGELTGWTNYARSHGLLNVCHLLLNTNEFLYLD